MLSKFSSLWFAKHFCRHILSVPHLRKPTVFISLLPFCQWSNPGQRLSCFPVRTASGRARTQPVFWSPRQCSPCVVPPFKHRVGELILDLLRPREYQSFRLYLFRCRLTGKAWAIDPNRPGFKSQLQHFQVVQLWTSCPTSLYRSAPSWCGTIFPLVTICILEEHSTVFKALSSVVTY